MVKLSLIKKNVADEFNNFFIDVGQNLRKKKKVHQKSTCICSKNNKKFIFFSNHKR